MTPDVKAFFDTATNTVSYVVQDPAGSSCAIIDSVLDFDYAAGATNTKSADEVIAYIKANDLRVDWILETHVHADHLSAAPYLQEQIGGKIGIGNQITVVQDTFGKVFNEGTEFQRDGSQFDQLFRDKRKLLQSGDNDRYLVFQRFCQFRLQAVRRRRGGLRSPGRRGSLRARACRSASR